MPQPTSRSPSLAERLGKPPVTGEKAELTAEDELDQIEEFLAHNFRAEYTAASHPDGSTVAEIVIRLLTHLGAHGNAAARCGEQYCNMPLGHFPATPHGWINTDPSSVAPG